eukprot:4693420-Pyramimonas_sp.AAC.1
MTQCADFAPELIGLAHGRAARPSVISSDLLDQLRAECIEYLWGEGEPKGWAAHARLPSARRLGLPGISSSCQSGLRR